MCQAAPPPPQDAELFTDTEPFFVLFAFSSGMCWDLNTCSIAANSMIAPQDGAELYIPTKSVPTRQLPLMNG